MKNTNTNMEAALQEAGVLEAADNAADEKAEKPFDFAASTPELVEAELKRLQAAAAEAAAETVRLNAEAAAAEEAAEAAKLAFRTAEAQQKAAFAVQYAEAIDTEDAAEKAARDAAEKAEKAAAAVSAFKAEAADVFVVQDFLTAFAADHANAASAAQIALAFHRPDKYLNDKTALQRDALALCRKVLGDVVPDTVTPSGIFFDGLTVKGALTLCALLTREKSLTVKEARQRFRVR